MAASEHYTHVVPNKLRLTESKEEILRILNGLKIENNEKLVAEMVVDGGKGPFYVELLRMRVCVSLCAWTVKVYPQNESARSSKAIRQLMPCFLSRFVRLCYPLLCRLRGARD